jgi:hypothetical protein
MGCFECIQWQKLSCPELYRGRFITTSEFFLLIVKAFADNHAANPAKPLQGFS